MKIWNYFTKINTSLQLIELRISKQIQEQQPCEQAGFRHGFSTLDHLQVINQLIEQSQEFDTELHLAFIDYTKAFDSLNPVSYTHLTLPTIYSV